MNSSELIVDTLRDRGVRWAFGIPSGPVLPLIEAMRSRGIEFVLTASETSAGFMAATVGALTGVPGVCVATLGPGATNLSTGVGAAWLDRAPVIAITCNVGTAWLQRRIQMRIDHHALFAPLTKASYPIRAGTVARTLEEALRVSVAEPPGPVHLDLPEDVAVAPVVDEQTTAQHTEGSERIGPELETGVIDALRRSRRPLVVTGLSMTRSQASSRLLEFVERQRIPFISTLHAKGMLPEDHPLWAGVLGRARRTNVQAFINRADLVIAVGFDPIEINYEEWRGATPLVHIDFEPVEGDLNVVLDAHGDLDDAIARLARVEIVDNEWRLEEIAAHREAFERALRPTTSAFAAHQVLDTLRAQLPKDGILAYDVGAHTHQIASQWRTNLPRTCISTNGWSSMGFGMPAAYAAKLVHPEKVVVGVVGDGCFRMTAGELDLARRLRLQVPIIVLNDGWLGLMKVKQERREYALSGVRLSERAPSPPHYFGVACRPARDLDEFRAALEWALGCDEPSVIEAFIDVESYSRTVFD